ncbi:cysteine hydrolase [Variovorax sp. DT-64]|uniref:cysteine hydrolase n=1 Tax=Variovorax sp. DT-64 TaxID=3396160 RepID=UPI003F1D0E67
MKRSIQLLLIDPQNDFCDLPASWLATDGSTGAQLQPALPVAGAHADMLRLAGLIREGAGGIAGITVTLDSHHRFDIAHPTFWQARDGAAVAPFTSITAGQVRGGDFQPRDQAALPRALAYIDELERRGRYTLMVWPVHCEIGSWGHNVHAAVEAAYNAWEDGQLRVVEKIAKGSNPWTEHYSAIQAEVPDAGDPGTLLNMPLVESLDRADMIVVAGEASSHCVKATTEHIVANLPSARPPKLVLVTDCMSPVTGFEVQHQAFLKDMAECGVQLRTSAEVLPLLTANT